MDYRAVALYSNQILFLFHRYGSGILSQGLSISIESPCLSSNFDKIVSMWIKHAIGCTL